MTELTINTGDYVVHRTPRLGNFEVRRAIKATGVRVHLETKGYCVNHAVRENILCATTNEAFAERLCARMESSRALMDQEKRGASDRHIARIAKLSREAAR